MCRPWPWIAAAGVALVVLVGVCPAWAAAPGQTPATDPRAYDRVTRDLAQAQADLAASRKALADTTVARDALRKELDAEKARHALTRAKLEQADKDLARADESLVAAQKTTAESQQLAGKTQAELATTRKTLQEAAGAREALSKELAASKKAADEAARAKVAAVKEVTALRDRQAELGQELERSRRWLTNASYPAPQGGRARFIVEVPITDAKLTIDGKPFEGGEGKVMREFVTARLTPGKRYSVDLRVVLTREGKTYSADRRVIFEPDTEQRVAFPVLEQEQ